MLEASLLGSTPDVDVPRSDIGPAMHASLPEARAYPPRKNLLLAALPDGDYQELLPHLERMPLPAGLTLFDSGGTLGYLIFPTGGIVSLRSVLESGATSEIALTGNEGVLGISLFLGGGNTPNRAVVQSSGHAYLMREKIFKSHCGRGGELERLLLLYSQALMAQAAQAAVCNRRHTAEQQVCRWMLGCLDRLPDTEIEIDEDTIENALGAGGEAVADVTRRLENANFIRCRRDGIFVLDRHQIEQRVCGCYAIVKRETERLRALKRRNRGEGKTN